MKFEQGGSNADQIETRRLITILEQTGNYHFIERKAGTSQADIDGQVVELPFTNMDGRIAMIVREDDGQWKYVATFQSIEDPDLVTLVRSKRPN